MKTLIKYEISKIFNRRINKIVLAGSLILCSIFLIAGLLTFEVIDTNMNVHKGMDAIKYDRSTQKQFEGEYSNEKATELLAEIQAVYNNPEYRHSQNEQRTSSTPLKEEYYYKYLKKYDPIWSIINFQQNAPDRIAKLEKGDLTSFYGQEVKSLMDMIKTPDIDGDMPIAQKLAAMSKEIKLPYHIEYIEGWNNLNLGFSLILAQLISVIIIICLAPIFSDEYHTKASAILLSTKYGKSKLNKAKIATAFIFSTGVFLLFLSLYAVFYGGTYGFSGMTSNIQISARFLFSPYNLTMGELFLRVIGIGYLGLLFLTTITLYISAKCKNIYTTLVILACTLYIPLINVSVISKTLQKIILLFPINIMWVSNIYDLPKIYNIFGLLIDQASMAVTVSVLLTLIFVPLSYRAFKSYQEQG